MLNEDTHSIALKMLLNVAKRGKLIDFGAGNGEASEYLKKKGFDVCACDITKERFNKDIPFREVNLNKELPFESNIFDYAYMNVVLEHLENTWQFFREAYRILKPKAIMIVSFPNLMGINTKIRFLLNGSLTYYGENAYKRINHIGIIPDWQFERMIENKFKINKIEYKQHKIPFTNIDIPIKSKLFGEIVFYELERL